MSHNNAACLLKDGKIVAFVEEERLNRIKHSPNIAPLKSIEFCLKEANIKLSDVDIIAVGLSSAEELFRFKLKMSLSRQFLPILKDLYTEKIITQSYENLLPFVRSKNSRVLFVRHHIAHAASAYYLSGFDQANILSWDGSGGQESGLLIEGRGNDLRIIDVIDTFQSWGFVWEFITEKLGFRKHSDEGKVMGLAAYGTPSKSGLRFIDKGGSFPRVNRSAFETFIRTIKQRDRNEPLTEYHKNLSATLQAETENAAEKMLCFLYQKNQIKNFCVTGGVSLNCSVNGYILQLPFVDKLFVQPVSQDAGTALGAAVYAYVQRTNKRPVSKFDHTYFGSFYSNEYIEHMLKTAKITTYKKTKNIEKEVAKLLTEGAIIGWFQGKMEAGPRALGGRSILADPRKESMKDKVNIIKNRELWRPLSPSILEEDAQSYLEGKYQRSPFMIIAYKTKANKRKEMPAVVHIDGTCRPQTVSKSTNPKYWNLINEFKRLTGVPVVLNTSFNLAGEPIVEKPEDTISTFFRCGLDYLAIGDYLIWKT